MHRILSGALRVDTLTVEIAGLPSRLEGVKIAQLSDLHYDGLRLSEQLLREAIATSNRFEPDIVVVTGDHVTDDPTPAPELARHLQDLQTSAGTYAILGNHDICPPGAQGLITQSFEQVGIHVLWNAIAYPFGEGLPLVGLADLWSREFTPALVLDTLDPDLPRIVLSHNPDSAVRLQAWRVDLQLSGHTHGGQIVIPGLGPFPSWYQQVRRYVPKKLRPWLPYMREDCHKVVKHWEWAQGLHQVGENLLYVNRGLGTFPPGRLFCPPELTIITLKCKVGTAPSCVSGETRSQPQPPKTLTPA
ncbi:MAG: metallophosphoesterase [Elainellaceae cyanobacterium]